MAKLPREVEHLLDQLKDTNVVSTNHPSKMHLGSLMLYVYDAKMKDKLPYWDALPLMLLMDVQGPYIQGVNLHFIPYTYRVQLMKDIVGKGNKIKYNDIKKAFGKVPKGYMLLAWRKYLVSHIRSNIKIFNEDNYLDAIKNVLPKFKGATNDEVIRDIQQKFKNQKGK